MVLEAVLADVMQQLLHLWNFDNAGAAESVQRIVGKPSLADVTAHLARGVVGGEAGKAHLFRLDQPTQVPNVFSLPTVPAMISWKSIFTERKKCFGRLEQWKHTALLGSEP